MIFKIKAIKSGVWVCGDTEASVKNGIRFFWNVTKVDQDLNIKKTGRGGDEEYMCKAVLTSWFKFPSY